MYAEKLDNEKSVSKTKAPDVTVKDTQLSDDGSDASSDDSVDSAPAHHYS